MTTDHRPFLLSILSQLDQIGSEADAILADPFDAEIGAMAKELRELVIALQPSVEEQLDQHYYSNQSR